MSNEADHQTRTQTEQVDSKGKMITNYQIKIIKSHKIARADFNRAVIKNGTNNGIENINTSFKAQNEVPFTPYM